MAAAAVTSAAPFLALLEEDDDALKVHALQQLDGLVSQFWYQISNYIPQVEALSEDEDFGSKEKASLLASKARSSLLTFERHFDLAPPFRCMVKYFGWNILLRFARSSSEESNAVMNIGIMPYQHLGCTR
jgi:hypothetical protein